MNFYQKMKRFLSGEPKGGWTIHGKSKRYTIQDEEICRPFSLFTKEIGSGSYGRVYAFNSSSSRKLFFPTTGDTVHQKNLVIKVVDLVFIERERASHFLPNTFEREANVATILGSHGIGPKVYATFIESDLGFIVMAKMKKLDQQKGIRQKIIEKLEKMHNLGFLHGDIYRNSELRTNNILVKKNDIYLIDFGFSMEKDDVQHLIPTKDNYYLDFMGNFEEMKKREMELVRQVLLG